MAKSKLNKIKGTKDFLVGAVFCGFLCLWSIRDAWFPTQKVLKKHPQEMAIAFKVPGTVQSLPLKPGEEIHGEAVLATLHDGAYKKAVADAEAEFELAKENMQNVEGALEKLLAARERLKACVLKNTDIMQKTSHGEDALRGVILEHMVESATSVQVLLAETTGTVSKITDMAVFISVGEEQTKEYPLGEKLVPVVEEEDEIAVGAALAGTPVLLVEPHDTFYIFNKSLAVIMFFGTIVMLVFHRIASR